MPGCLCRAFVFDSYTSLSWDSFGRDNLNFKFYIFIDILLEKNFKKKYFELETKL